ncbi:MAG: TOBE domain-containing protein [Candidatus Eisenbacteria bacterium]|nr:TOBE domain-containing protein [Candidatus Eisenbacteria bacterium]
MPILYVTHDAGEALALADHVVVLEGGRCVAAGPPEQLLRTPATLRLLDLLRLENRLVVATAREQPERGWTAIEIEGGLRIAGPAGAGFREGEAIGIRAEDILVAREKPGAISARNILPARLLEMQDEGERILLSLESSGVALRATTTRDAAGDLALAPGQGVWLVFKAQAVHRLIELPGHPTESSERAIRASHPSSRPGQSSERSTGRPAPESGAGLRSFTRPRRSGSVRSGSCDSPVYRKVAFTLPHEVFSVAT